MLKVFVFSVAVVSVLLVLPVFGPSKAAAEGGKILVAYFSHSGNTREIAKRIHGSVGGDLFEIGVTDPYPSAYRECTDRAKKEQNENARPTLSAKVENMDSYDIVFLGYPNWWGTMPMSLFTFLEQYDFSGKSIIPFCTHGGGGLGRSERDIAALSPKAALLQALSVNGSGVGNAQNAVAEWLKMLGMTG